jgi:hypothetical protein
MGDHVVKLGLGEAIQRLIRVELSAAMGYRVQEDALSEAAMLRRTLDQYDLEVHFDCNADGVPDTVEIYQAAADTSCCRLVEPDRVMTRRSRKDGSRRLASGGSRRKK